jgi:hypothetical protein
MHSLVGGAGEDERVVERLGRSNRRRPWRGQRSAARQARDREAQPQQQEAAVERSA